MRGRHQEICEIKISEKLLHKHKLRAAPTSVWLSLWLSCSVAVESFYEKIIFS